MFRKVLGAVVVLGVCFGLALGDEIKGRIVKISDQSVSLMTVNKETKKEETKSYPLAKDVKFFQKVKDEKTAVEGGLKASVFKDIDPKKGLAALLVTKDNKVTQIVVSPPKKKS